ncbi:MAG: FAD-dependent oxidoreductase [Paracoccaceae bacterium]
MPYDYRRMPYETPAPLKRGEAEERVGVAIVGAGPIGLALAVDLAMRGVASVVLDDNDVVSVGSRAICWAKRSLEILDRLGVGERIAEKGVTWKVGRTYHGDEEVWSFDLLPEDGHKMPAFVNLQQYYVEEYLVERCRDFPDLIDLRVLNTVSGVSRDGSATVSTPDGAYRLKADRLVACDGARSPIREGLGLEFVGELFEERFLIADIVMKADFPAERRFWFEPPFHEGQSALLHKQPDDLWRIDLQLGWDADPEEEKKPETVIPRIERIVGDRPFELDWVSVYTFQCRRLARFVHDRVIFCGDSAHVVSPFGARGGNGGLQDVDNLGWKLALVAKGEAPEALLESYEAERIEAADENIRNSSRATRFMTPHPGAERWFRDAVLALAKRAPFARSMVNSGRLSRPCAYSASPLSGPDDAALPEVSRPGAPAPDAPFGDGWLLNALPDGFTVLVFGGEAHLPGATTLVAPREDALRARYLGEAERAFYLIRPDQHVAARWTRWDKAAAAEAMAKAKGGAS